MLLCYLGCCFLRGGCHKHPKFNLIVEAHEAENVPKGSNCYLYVECGRFDRQSQGKTVESTNKTLRSLSSAP